MVFTQLYLIHQLNFYVTPKIIGKSKPLVTSTEP